ncbi:MAG TPA: hypothetical protein VHU80_20310 [Polyangiaceae bacterium]|nr:hypothetical protein [Polyangiaceae bacterium]
MLGFLCDRSSGVTSALFVLVGCNQATGTPSVDAGGSTSLGANGGTANDERGGTMGGSMPSIGGLAGPSSDGGGASNSGPNQGKGGADGRAGTISDGGAGAPRSTGTGSAGTTGSGGAAAGGNAGSTGNGGAGGAMATCVTAGTELCDDFESGHIDGAKWQMPKPSSGVSVTLDDSRAHGGKYSVHVHGVAGQINNGVLAETVSFPAQNNSFYARIFAYFLPDLPAAPGGDFHTGFIVGSGKNDLGDVQAGMGLIGGEKQFLGYSIFYGAPSYEFGPWANTKVVPGEWLCLELWENGSSPDTEIRKVWVDDKELTELESDSARAAGTDHPNHRSPKFDRVTVGLWEFHPSPALTDMWVDDVRVSASKIGCK